MPSSVYFAKRKMPKARRCHTRKFRSKEAAVMWLMKNGTAEMTLTKVVTKVIDLAAEPKAA